MSVNGTAHGGQDVLPHGAGGVVELREDVPLKRGVSSGGRGGSSGTGVSWCGGGPRVIPGAFAALSACITVALVAQIYCGDYEVVPHGSVASSAAACSRAGTDALKAGGRALDAAAAAALCLAVLAPHRTSLDASGSMLYWEYRELRTQQPQLYEWGAGGASGTTQGEWGEAVGGERPPRLVAALAYLHAHLGVLPWGQVLQPAIQLASEGFPVSEGLASVDESLLVNSNATAPELANYLRSLLSNTSAELSAAWNSSSLVRQAAAARVSAGGWRAVAGGAGGGAALRALQAALEPPPSAPDDAQLRVVSALQREARAGGAAGAGGAGGVASGLAVVDRRDTYVALVTGVSVPFGSGPASAAGWRRDTPRAPLDLAPALLLDAHVCGSRYVVGAESWAALAQVSAALAGGGGAGAVERARLALDASGALALEAARAPPPATPPAPLRNATPPYAAVNLVLQRADDLASHADSRGGGLASRF